MRKVEKEHSWLMCEKVLSFLIFETFAVLRSSVTLLNLCHIWPELQGNPVPSPAVTHLRAPS